MRVPQKSILKTTLQVSTSERTSCTASTAVCDMLALLLTINWPSSALMLCVIAFKVFVMKALAVGKWSVFIFDRYFDDSTKAYCRLLWQENYGTSRVHVLKSDMPTPPKNAILGVCKKTRCNWTKWLLRPSGILRPCNRDWTQLDCCWNWRCARGDCECNASGAARSCIRSWRGLPHHYSSCNIMLSSRGDSQNCMWRHRRFYSAALHFYVSCKCVNVLYMSSPVANRSIVYLRATAKKHSDIAMSILVAYALARTDTVVATFSVGKSQC